MFSPENQVDSDFDKQKGIGGTTDTMPQRFNLHFNIKRGEFLHHFLANFSPKKFLFSIAFFRFILYNNLCSPLIGGRFARRCVGTGRRGGLKIHCQRWRAGSIPATGTKRTRPECYVLGGFFFCFAVFVSINCCVVNLCVLGYPDFDPLQRRKMSSTSVPHILLHRVEMAAEKAVAGQQSKATIAFKEKRLNLSEKPPIFGAVVFLYPRAGV